MAQGKGGGVRRMRPHGKRRDRARCEGVGCSNKVGLWLDDLGAFCSLCWGRLPEGMRAELWRGYFAGERIGSSPEMRAVVEVARTLLQGRQLQR